MATTLAHLLTYADLEEMPEDEYHRYEVVGGELVVSPSPTTLHQACVLDLTVLLTTFVVPRGLGRVLPGPTDVKLSEYDVVVPDLLFVSREREQIIGRQAVEGAPDLVVEVFSPSTRSRDQGRKLALYAAFGVREYWMADAEARAFRALALRAGRYEPIPEVDGMVASVVLPGLEVDVAALFAGQP